MSSKKPNVGKPMQWSEGFLIKQYQSTIWVSKLAYPTNNFLGNNTSWFLTNLLAETLDNPSGKSSAQNCSKTPASAQSGLRRPLLAQRWPCISLSWPTSTPRDPALALWASASAIMASLVLCAILNCLCVALCERWLLLHHSLWLLSCSPGIIFASLSLCTQCPSAALWSLILSLSKPYSRK